MLRNRQMKGKRLVTKAWCCPQWSSAGWFKSCFWNNLNCDLNGKWDKVSLDIVFQWPLAQTQRCIEGRVLFNILHNVSCAPYLPWTLTLQSISVWFSRAPRSPSDICFFSNNISDIEKQTSWANSSAATEFTQEVENDGLKYQSSPLILGWLGAVCQGPQCHPPHGRVLANLTEVFATDLNRGGYKADRIYSWSTISLFVEAHFFPPH